MGINNLLEKLVRTFSTGMIFIFDIGHGYSTDF